jgi:uncharacterized protein YkwD
MRRLVPSLFIAAVAFASCANLLAQGRGTDLHPRTVAVASPDKKLIRSSAEQQIFDLLNLEREKAGLDKLVWNDQLAQAAREHSRLLARNRALSHQFPSESPLKARLAVTGARFGAAAENVADGSNPEEIHAALMHSPGHRANIMSPAYNAVGVSVVEVQGQLFVTQDFAAAIRIYNEAEFRETFISTFNRARKTKGLLPLEAWHDPALRSAACSTRGDPQPVLAGINAPAEVVTFTLSDPEKLPDTFAKYVQTRRWNRMGVGVCFRPDPTYGYGNFWVVVEFGN